jgi:hypothetical protein
MHTGCTAYRRHNHGRRFFVYILQRKLSRLFLSTRSLHRFLFFGSFLPFDKLERIEENSMIIKQITINTIKTITRHMVATPRLSKKVIFI